MSGSALQRLVSVSATVSLYMAARQAHGSLDRAQGPKLAPLGSHMPTVICSRMLCVYVLIKRVAACAFSG